jgi:multiple sugar transport system ATP-binding protein
LLVGKQSVQVEYKDVTKVFGRSTVVDHLNLVIDDAELVVFLGPSGCGKTTTLRMLAGLEEASSGDIFIGEERVNNIPTRYRDIAMVFQNYALYPHMTIAENIAYPLKVRKVSRDQIDQRVKRVAESLEIGALLSRRPRELSGGERQRVALARAIIREPRVYLMDEPLSNLDAKLRVQMRGELKRLQHELGTTTIYVTHDQAEAMTLAHRVAIMRDGKLQQFDTPMNIYNQPANRFVAEFVGSPSMNFIEGKLDSAARSFVAEGLAVTLPESKLAMLDGHDRITLGVRPENIDVSQVERAGWFNASVYVTEEMGNETFVFLTMAADKVIARAPADFRAEMESKVWVQIDMGKVMFFDPASGEALLTAADAA